MPTNALKTMLKKNYFLYLNRFEIILFIFCISFVGSIEDNSKKNEDMYFFKLRREKHLEAVKTIRKMQEDKQQKMVNAITNTVFEVILKSRAVLESSGYVPGVSEFPETETIRDALSLILENTALMGDILLRLPEVAEPVLRSTSGWPVLFAWSLAFANQTQLLDNNTKTLIELVNQELNLTTRSPDYINPYRKPKNKVKLRVGQEKEQVKKKKKRTLIPRGPRLTLPQAGEL